MKLGRNEPCHCGSKEKYKKCCQEKDIAAEREGRRSETAPEDVRISRSMFIGGPFRPCPSCTRETFGVFVDAGRGFGYQRECTSCRYKEHRPFPRVQKRIIYLDQFVISNITKLLDNSCRGHQAISSDPFWMELYAKIELGRDLQAVVCPDSDFHSQESFISTDPAYEALKDVYEHLSSGVTFYDHHSIQRFQVQAQFEHWLSGGTAPLRRPIADQVMHGEPHAWSGRIRISVDAGRPFDDPDKMIASRRQSHARFATLFQKWQNSQQNINQSVLAEARAFGRTSLRLYGEFIERQFKKTQYYEAEMAAGRRPEFDLEDLLPPPAAELIQVMVMAARHKGLDRNEALDRICQFLESDDVLEVPSVKLTSYLYASLNRKAAEGQRSVPSEGVFTDVEAIGNLLPYCDAMILDREMAGLLRDEPLRSAVTAYGTRILSMSNRQDILSYLDEIIASVPTEQREVVVDYMGEPGKPNLRVVEYGRSQRTKDTFRNR